MDTAEWQRDRAFRRRSLHRLIHNVGVFHVLRLVLTAGVFLAPALGMATAGRRMWVLPVMACTLVILPRLCLDFIVSRKPRSLRWPGRITWIGLGSLLLLIPALVVSGPIGAEVVFWFGMSLVLFGSGATAWVFSDHRVINARGLKAIGESRVVRDFTAGLIGKSEFTDAEKTLCISKLDAAHDSAYSLAKTRAGSGNQSELDLPLYCTLVFEALALRARADGAADLADSIDVLRERAEWAAESQEEAV